MATKRKKWLAAALLVGVAAAGATVLHFGGGATRALSFGALTRAFDGSPPTAAQAGGSPLERQTRPYIVVFPEAPVASYKGEVSGLAAPARATGGSARGRIDMRSAAARQYVQHLKRVQATREAELSRAIGRPLQVRHRMQHAINGVIAELAPAEANRLRRMPGVRLVEEYREYEIETDTGPLLIGADRLWLGTTPGNPGRFQGEGVVVGVIDTGINFGSPSFAATGPLDGHAHVNPLGAGNFLGTCAPGGIDAGRCNDKLIGGYDFVCNVAPDPSQPTQTICTLTSLYREEPGFGDTNGHGSHVASTAAGNHREVLYKGRNLRISGVAPHANIVAYDVCYTRLADGRGLCPNVSSVAAVDQAVADGVVDVLNFSIGGGADPWSDAVSLAFLNAVDAGIYVATSAGNAGPAPNTLSHNEPWTASTAAAQHGRDDYALLLDVTGPTPVPPALQGIVLNEGTGGVSLSGPVPGTTPLVVSPGIDTAADGCAAFAPNTFQNAIALVRRGTCAFTVKAGNAAAAGAIAVVIANNQPGGIIPSVPGATIPVFGVTQASGDALRDFAAAHPGAVTAGIRYPGVLIPNTPDQLAAFSSRGPAGAYDLLKPDVTAPGVNILAVIAGTTVTGFENAVGLMSGTSMASPHHAGAAALLRQAHPDWTAPEIKSALAMTAKREVLLEDGTTAADPFARGAGRIQVDRAVRAGLVMHETRADYLAADPATGGDPATLNQPSLIRGSCFLRCTFQRTFRNTLAHRQTWAVRVEGLRGAAWPLVFSVAPGESRTIAIVVDSHAIAPDGRFRFGTLVLTPVTFGTGTLPTLRLPMAIAVQPPALALAPEAVGATVPAGGIGSVTVDVRNEGGSWLRYSVERSGSGSVTIARAAIGAQFSGFRSTRYTDSTNPLAQFAADDFTLGESTRLSRLVADGFVSSGLPLASTASQLTWSLYPDNGGAPAGNPETAPALAVWSYTAAPGSPGVSTTGGTIALDLAAAGQDVTLPAGRYWLVVHARSTFANRWVWFASDSGSGGFSTITLPTPGAWSATTAFPGLAWQVEGQVACGAPWIAAAIPSADVLWPDGSRSVRLVLNAGGLAPGAYAGYVCVASNDPLRPRVALRVSMTVTP